MKLAYTIMFSLIIFLSGSKNLLYIIDYHANRDFYESVCENKNRPEMECHGKCQVSKEMNETLQSFSFSSLGLDFHFIAAQDLLMLTAQLNKMLDFQIPKQPVSFWTKVMICIPDPPPDFNFN